MANSAAQIFYSRKQAVVLHSIPVAIYLFMPFLLRLANVGLSCSITTFYDFIKENNLGKVMQKGICLVGMMGSTSMVLQVPAAVDEGDGRVGVVGPFQSKGFMEGLEQWELLVMPGQHLIEELSSQEDDMKTELSSAEQRSGKRRKKVVQD
ncbi:hypothetical protein LOK49_LG02G03257 [Camellia lanceoleosa]|uniref:Uncharacterized protein n=1 Tax=Camellia lanceoleosa TaxID=1840588 RepID=A0ACC0IQ58_9ERIC|nr:hypothetical protein LOK49_LG02G03257 [Camellia lanceoleosa]